MQLIEIIPSQLFDPHLEHLTVSFHPRSIFIAALLPLVLAGCAAAPGMDYPEYPGWVPPTVPDGYTDVSDTYVSRFPGDVAPGSLRWGSSITGNSSPAPLESVARRNFGLRRTFYGWSQRTGSMVSTARADLAAGRLPWVSVKPPSWAAMANGTYDAQIDEMLRALDGLDGPVWLTVHHEPEGGGGVNAPDDPAGAIGWRQMQRRVRMRMNVLGTDNIAFAPILMSWTFEPRSGRVPGDWWVDGIWDFVGIDHYQTSIAAPGMFNSNWAKMYAFVSSKGMKLAIGEWGNRGTDMVAAAEMQQFYDVAVASGRTGGAQVIGLSYFNSNLNSSTGGWELSGEPLNRFLQILTLGTSVSARQTR